MHFQRNVLDTMRIMKYFEIVLKQKSFLPGGSELSEIRLFMYHSAISLSLLTTHAAPNLVEFYLIVLKSFLTSLRQVTTNFCIYIFL